MLEKSILVVDDEENIRELLKFNLEKNGYKVICAGDGIEALNMVRKTHPDLLLLDVMLPGMDGIEVCKEIRKDTSISLTPIIMVTAKGDEFDKVLGLELGADDYITKPFSLREVIARIKVIFRRVVYKSDDKVFKFGNISVDFSKHEVLKDNVKIDLTLKEFELLEMLIRNNGKVLTRDTILDKIWSYEFVGETRTVDVHVRHLRQKLEGDDSNPVYIETVRGIGYRLNLGSEKTQFVNQ